MARKTSNRFRPELENLEGRLLLHGGGLLPALAAYELAAETHSLPDVDLVLSPQAQERIDQAMGLPVYNSNPGAPATLHLDFTGSFGEVGLTDVAPFDIDGRPSTFSDAEKAVILEVWQRVSEDFAPFNINVTTAYYGPLEERTFTTGPDRGLTGGDFDAYHGVALTVYMNRHYPGTGSGNSDIGSYGNQYANQVFVYSKEIWEWSLQGTVADFESALATTASHEAGHAFGLSHQRVDENGVNVDYSPGTDVWTPIMGDNLSNDRTTWADGPRTWVNDGSNLFHDELATLAGPANGFGYRPDDHGNSLTTASEFNYSISNVPSAHGIIEKMDDVDVFRFTTNAGNISLGVHVAEVGPNLDVKIELRDSRGRLLATADPDDSLNATIERRVSAGTYYLSVKSHGTYGDLGQYTISGVLKLPRLAVPTNSSLVKEVSSNLPGPSVDKPLATRAPVIVVPTLPPSLPPVAPIQISMTPPPASPPPAPAQPAGARVAAVKSKTSVVETASRSTVATKKTDIAKSAIDRVFAEKLGADKVLASRVRF